jgi:predicted nucleic-acid-binding Zn-ribbon protein
MKKGQCPKCGLLNVYMKNNGIAANTYLFVSISGFSYVYLDNYICTDCGYVESYVADKSKLPAIASKWDRVSNKQ